MSRNALKKARDTAATIGNDQLARDVKVSCEVVTAFALLALAESFERVEESLARIAARVG